ncbi:MAG: long-chain fatty acid--CoA ligase [Fimbriimonas sp.]|nr:long-chain fatty acid--CoA ligase [Fimbriimonas sp.]
MEAKSLGDMLRRTANRLPDKVAMLAPDKAGFREIRYGDLIETVRRYAGVIRSMGVDRGDKLVILSENCVEWAFTDWACQTLGITVVPIYPTLPADQVAYVVNDCDAKLVVAGGVEQLSKVARLEGVHSVLLKGDDSLDSRSSTSSAGLDPAAWNAEIDATGLEDIATIIYTSGTTGIPKGAMLAHRTFIHVCECAHQQLPLYETDLFLTFLPMSHVYERVAGQCLPICMGATIAYAKSLASLAGDIVKTRPTVLLCVPRFLDSFREKVMDGVEKMPPIRRKLFEIALSQGTTKAKGGFAPLAGLLDRIVMYKLRERLGGRMRYFVSGGAALPQNVAEFYMGAGLTVLQGYGLTETCGGTCVNHPDRNQYWTVGESLGMDIKIADDGEILVKGPALMTGYYHLPEETAQAIDAEGWFHTGDIGEFEGENLKITDRKKDLIVLGNGKNVPPQPIETKLTASHFISEAVVLGDGMEYCIALIVPNFEAVRSTLGLGENAVLSKDDAARSLIKKEIDRTNKTLANFEIVKKHAILDVPFTIDGGELTPTLKVKRKVVKEKYSALIAEMKR